MSARTFKPLVVFTFTLFCLHTLPKDLSAQKKDNPVLSLDTCISIALKNATVVQSARNQLNLSGADVLKSYGQFLPSLTVGAGYTFYARNNNLEQVPFTQTLGNGDTLSTISTTLFATESRRASYNISSTLNIFNGLADYAALKQSLNNENASQYSLKRAKEQIAFDVAQSYLQILLNQELLKISEENLNAANDQLSRIREQVNVGAKAISDLYQQESVVSTNELDVITSENNLRNSQIALLQRLKLNPAQEYTFEIPPLDTSKINESVYSSTSIINKAFKNRTDLKSAEFAYKASDWGTNVAFSGYLPRLDLIFNLSSSGILIDKQTIDGIEVPSPVLPDISRQLEDQTNTSLTLNLSWTIFDGFLTNLNHQRARVDYLNRKLTYEDTKLQISAEVTQSIGDYKAAQKQLESAEKGLKSSEKAFETVQQQYDVGGSTFVELSGARASLVAAQSQYAQSVYNFTFQKKLLDFFMGTLDVEQYMTEPY